MTGLGKLQQLYGLFAPRTVLLPIHPGTKKCYREGWQNTTWETTQQPHYQSELASGGVAVLFGPENLAGLDCDTEERVAEFLEFNPLASQTTQTRGARGRTFHFRLRGDYPKLLCKLKTVDGQKIGEWRGADGYTVVSGIHPDTGAPYRILVEKSPLPIDWNKIIWPPHWNVPWQQKTVETGVLRASDTPGARLPIALFEGKMVEGRGNQIGEIIRAALVTLGRPSDASGGVPASFTKHRGVPGRSGIRPSLSRMPDCSATRQGCHRLHPTGTGAAKPADRIRASC
jgi:hypothetical protein